MPLDQRTHETRQRRRRRLDADHGDARLFERLDQRAGLVVGKADRDDLFQEVATQLWKSIPTFKEQPLALLVAYVAMQRALRRDYFPRKRELQGLRDRFLNPEAI